MTADPRAAVLVVASEAELPSCRRVWGTGGWLPPAQREALDWVTLSRLLGWGVTVARETGGALEGGLDGESRRVIIACDPDSLPDDAVALLASRFEAEPLLIVARTASPHRPLARLAGAAREPERIRGRRVSWIGPGSRRDWHYRRELEAGALDLSHDVEVWTTLDGAPLIVARRVGRGVVATLGFHPSEVRDLDGAGTALLRHLLIWGAAPVAWLDLEGSLVLRMDDPGGAQNVHLRSWYHRKLDEAEWAAIGAILAARNARMSIGYIAGWVDDGDASRGVLTVAGGSPHRVPGRVYPSPIVRYHDRAGHTPGTIHDYEAEFRGIQALRAAGLLDVELHGHTHMFPDAATWASAPDRYDAVVWYRELGPAATAAITARPPEQRPLALGASILRRYFGEPPVTLICPGDQWTDDVLQRALGLGLELVSSYYLALREGARFCWAQHVCAPYLNEPSHAWFDAGLPVVGYFHDRDVAQQRIQWMGKCLDGWRNAGARRFLTLRELAAALGHRLFLEETSGEPRLRVRRLGAASLPRPLPVGIRWPEGPRPSHVTVSMEGRTVPLTVRWSEDDVGRLVLPAFWREATAEGDAGGLSASCAGESPRDRGPMR